MCRFAPWLRANSVATATAWRDRDEPSVPTTIDWNMPAPLPRVVCRLDNLRSSEPDATRGVARMTIVNDRDRHRFVIDENGAEAELVYELDGTSLRLIHTEVPPQFQGHGTGGQLVQAAVDWARTD